MVNIRTAARAALKPMWGLSSTILVTMGLSACGGGNDTPAPATTPTTVKISDAAARCTALVGTSIPASSIGLSTGGATVTAAAVVPSVAASGSAAATPEYCKVTGSIAAAQASDPSILYQVNLPSEWNFKTVQFGGGGTNGTVITGTGNVVNAGSAVTPLQRGYVTFGGDSGHQGGGAEFFLNDTATANYAHEGVKKTKDVATALIQSYYKAAQKRNYYIGGSKGGQEGLHAAQRYAADYDGVMAYYPAAQFGSLVLSWYRLWDTAYSTPGATLLPAKVALLQNAIRTTCDTLDGVADGIVSNLQACAVAFSVQTLRCTGGIDTGDTCLSDQQIATLDVGASPMNFAFTMPNGVASVGPWPMYNLGDLNLIYSASGLGTDSLYYVLFLPGDIKYAFVGDANAPVTGFDYRNFKSRVDRMTGFYDASNPNVDAFVNKGGKLLMVHGTTDLLVPTAMTTGYYNSLGARYGSKLKDFARYYVAPGFGHGFGAFTLEWDSLTALDAWVETGKAPESPVVTDGAAATKGRTRPLCEYPAWPRYNGTGDVNTAASYTCIAS
jgi:feruloyl esterase